MQVAITFMKKDVVKSILFNYGFFLCILLSQCLFVYFYQNNYKKTERRMVSIKNIETNAKKLFKTFPAEVTNVSKADYSKKLF